MNAFNDFNNPQVKALPDYLKQFIIEQHYEHYTPIDHAVWRFVMRQNSNYLKDIAYYSYSTGLNATGLSIEKIPDLQEMNDALKEIGWGAVSVDGFIPPTVVMEFQSYRVLVIVANIRPLESIANSPLPDIIHGATVFASIIANPDYQEYLSKFSSITSKAIYSSKDIELYKAIRELSILKEKSNPDLYTIEQAEKKALFSQRNLADPTELALLGRLHCWTIEYGLIGSLQDPKIYGIQLLSSLIESRSCMDSAVKKNPYTSDALNFPFDITKPPSQLFVTPDFQNLFQVLEDFADTMSFRRGGSESLLKAIECKNICTAVYSSGLQVSGVFSDLRMGKDDELQFIKTSGPSALSFEDEQLSGHGKTSYKDGFSSPVGRLKNFNKALESASDTELEELGIRIEHPVTLNFCSGMILKGILKSIERRSSKIILLSFIDCCLQDEQGNSYYEPSRGIYNMAVGETICSVYCGAADKKAFDEIIFKAGTGKLQPEYDDKDRRYHQLFAAVRISRETQSEFERLTDIWHELKKDFRADWLCAMEILEILELMDIVPPLAREIRIHLEIKASNEPELSKLIYQGLHLIHRN